MVAACTFYSVLQQYFFVYARPCREWHDDCPFAPVHERAADGTCHHHSSLSEVQLFHLLTIVQVQDGVVHSLLLQIYAASNYKVIENPVYPDHLIPVLGKLSLRAPPFA